MTQTTTPGTAAAAETSTAPARAGLVLVALILVAAVANLNLAVANVALPDIGIAFDSSQTTLDLVAVGYSLGLAASVLYLGALGRPLRAQDDARPRDLAVDPGVHRGCVRTVRRLPHRRPHRGRHLGRYGVPDDARPDHGAVVGAGAHEGDRPVVRDRRRDCRHSVPSWPAACCEKFWWGSVFLVTLPLAAVALVLAVVLVPSHVNETSDPVDNLGGILSAILVGALIVSINFASVPNEGTVAIGLGVVAAAAAIAFFIRQRRAESRCTTCTSPRAVSSGSRLCAGIIVFGSLMAAMFIGQQFLQNVLGYSTLQAGASILPAVFLMVLVAPRSAKLIEARGARFTLLLGYVFVLFGFLTMYALWDEGTLYWEVGLAYAFVGIGVGFAGTPASHSLTGFRSREARRHGLGHRRPPARSRRRHHAVDPRRSPDRGLLGGGRRARSRRRRTAARSATRPRTSCNSRSPGPRTSPRRNPQYAKQIIAGAKSSFVDGADWAYLAGIVAILLGFVVVFFFYPKKDEEQRLLAEYAGRGHRAASEPGPMSNNGEDRIEKGQVMEDGIGRVAKLRRQPLAGAPFWLLLLVLWGLLEIAWRWRRARARFS